MKYCLSSHANTFNIGFLSIRIFFTFICRNLCKDDLIFAYLIYQNFIFEFIMNTKYKNSVHIKVYYQYIVALTAIAASSCRTRETHKQLSCKGFLSQKNDTCFCFKDVNSSVIFPATRDLVNFPLSFTRSLECLVTSHGHWSHVQLNKVEHRSF